jgi:hypothetical protein
MELLWWTLRHITLPMDRIETDLKKSIKGFENGVFVGCTEFTLLESQQNNMGNEKWADIWQRTYRLRDVETAQEHIAMAGDYKTAYNYVRRAEGRGQ